MSRFTSILLGPPVDGEEGEARAVLHSPGSAIPGGIVCWPEIAARMGAKRRWLLVLGFDGILSPIVPRPREAEISAEALALLARASESPNVALALFSGRSLPDIRERVCLPHVFYAGNHGMEIQGPGFHSSDGLASSCRSDLVEAFAFLTKHATKLPGVLIEDKGLAVTVHWRMASQHDMPGLYELLDDVLHHHPRLKWFSGNACLELRARASWNKSEAVRQILMHLGLSPAETIYLGEEYTDEDAFAYLSEGLTFCVGGGKSTGAHHRLQHPADAVALVRRLVETINGGSDHAARSPAGPAWRSERGG